MFHLERFGLCASFLSLLTAVPRTFTGEIDDARWKRIEAAIKGVGVEWLEPKTDTDGKPVLVNGEPASVMNVRWVQRGLENFLRVTVGDRDRAVRLASELRACGMVVKGPAQLGLAG